MKIETKCLISDAILFYLTSIIVIVSILSIDYILECGLLAFIADILFCTLLVYACKIAIPAASYRTILGYDLWLKLFRGGNHMED